MNKKKKNKKILMVEGDAFTRKVYKDELDKLGFTYSEATNGVEGLNKVLYEKPDLVLLDVVLPIKNGFELLREMKEKKETKKIPVVILSNLGSENNIKTGLSLGAEEYLVKTETDFVSVISIIKKILK
ncbi:PleD family two-component system response regulator [Patescibacteria group bacterium]